MKNHTCTKRHNIHESLRESLRDSTKDDRRFDAGAGSVRLKSRSRLECGAASNTTDLCNVLLKSSIDFIRVFLRDVPVPIRGSGPSFGFYHHPEKKVVGAIGARKEKTASACEENRKTIV